MAPAPLLVLARVGAWQIGPTHTASWFPKDIACAQHATETFKPGVGPMPEDAEVHDILPRSDGFH
jgi:hypothetical protein